MRYWVSEMHVDGFRFDLASVFSRNADGSINPDDPALRRHRADPVLRDIRLIAEPWDAAGGTSSGARSRAPWHQWNGRFRDDVRLRQGTRNGRPLMKRLYGSNDLFPDDAETPTATRASTSSPATTGSPSTTWSPTTGSTTRRTATANRRNRRQPELELRLGGRRRRSRRGDGPAQTPGEELLLPPAPLQRHPDVPRRRRDSCRPSGATTTRTTRTTRRPGSTGAGCDARTTTTVRPADDRVPQGAPTVCRSRFWRDDVRWYGADRSPT